MNFSELLHMNGHGFYVWLSYGVALLVFLFLLLEPVQRRKGLRLRLQRFWRRESLSQQNGGSA